MARKQASSSAVFRAMREKSDAAREVAQREIKALARDLAVLDQILSGKRKRGDFSLFDVAHGAFEIFRNAAAVFEAEDLARDMERAMGETLAVEYLEKHGASLLVKPAGWHWISPQGEMHFLGKAEEADKASEKLAGLLPGAKKPKKSAKKAAPATESETFAEGELGT